VEFTDDEGKKSQGIQHVDKNDSVPLGKDHQNILSKSSFYMRSRRL
jgi:hypothetical protein